jgi:hypothetical protein
MIKDLALKMAAKLYPSKGRHHRVAATALVATAVLVDAFLPGHACFEAAIVAVALKPAVKSMAEALAFKRYIRSLPSA